MHDTSSRPTAVSIVNLGCPKNQVDAEIMLGQLAAAGYHIAEDPHQADVVVVNTCGFIEDAKTESIEAVLATAQLKQSGRCRAVLVSGCLSQRYAGELPRLLPEADGFIGTGEFPRIAEIVRTTLAGNAAKVSAVTGHTALVTADLPRRRLTPAHLAYLKIAEGCDHTCRFCAIPAIRGRFQSRTRADVVAEARALADQGGRELVLISQDTTSFGADRGEDDGLVRLLRDLLTVAELRWIRLHYLYPTRISPALIALMAEEPRLCRYLDLPLQHADTGVLKAMGRGGSAESLSRLIGRIRDRVPDVVIRTSFITGFPGETAAAFAVLAKFVEAMRFDRVGVFRYSDEEGTSAAALDPKVPRRIALARQARLMAIQATIAEAKNQALVGSVQTVLVDGPSAEQPGVWCARTAGHAPDVDGTVFLRGFDGPAGVFARAQIEEAFEHDLAGRVLELLP